MLVGGVEVAERHGEPAEVEATDPLQVARAPTGGAIRKGENP
jgi:hypothetical protein